ncbi:MAG TPA: hypothetical protein VI612_05555 [Candidatus Nanoarchaeia archaeon]|nr:hypothetical protein [Candidatus Nanoarchaeia archaeon]
MFKILYDPVSVIKQEVKNPSFPRILLMLFAASLFETIGLLFIVWKFLPFLLTQNFIVLGILVSLFGLIASHLVVAFFFSLVMHVLDGKGGYYDGLSTLVLGMIAPAVAIFFAGAFVFIPFGLFFALLLLSYGYVLGAATLFRAAKELFSVDYAGVLIGFLITSFVLGSALCAAFIL